MGAADQVEGVLFVGDLQWVAICVCGRYEGQAELRGEDHLASGEFGKYPAVGAVRTAIVVGGGRKAHQNARMPLRTVAGAAGWSSVAVAAVEQTVEQAAAVDERGG